MALFLRFTAIPSQVGPGVRIRLAPAESQQTLSPSREIHPTCSSNAVTGAAPGGAVATPKGALKRLSRRDRKPRRRWQRISATGARNLRANGNQTFQATRETIGCPETT